MNSVALPVILPLIFAVITGLIGSDQLRKKFALAGFFFHLCLCAWLVWLCQHHHIQTLSAGNWQAPYGIVLIADLFASIFLFSISLVFLVTNLYSFAENPKHSGHILRLPLVFILQAGVSLSLLTADFFNLFVAFEVMLAASYALFGLEVSSQYLKWAFSYLIINLIGTLGFLCAIAMIYGYTGHLNMASLSHLLQGQENNPLIIGWSYLLLGIFGLKAGIFPLYFWLPKAYSYLPSSLAALFAGSLTKVGIYVLIRMMTILLPGPLTGLNNLILLLSAFTMLIGVLGAVSRSTIKSILSYHIISQIGYMTLGIGLYTPIAVASSLLFVIHNIWVKVSLFLIGGTAEQMSQTGELKKMGNLSSFAPWLAAAFLLQALALAGLPPLSGFWGKYLIILESIRAEQYIPAVAALITSWLTLFSMIKIWIGAFWSERKDKQALVTMDNKRIKIKYFSFAMLIIPSLMLGFGIEYAYQIAIQATEQIFHKEEYIQAVLTISGKG